jgi:hypothetical protein
MRRRRDRKALQYTLLGATTALVVGAQLVTAPQNDGPVLVAAAAAVRGTPISPAMAVRVSDARGAETATALEAFSSAVHGLSHPRALEDAFRSYFAYRAAHPEKVTKPYLYFVDYGLPSTTPRGWVFDMDTREVVDGPFMVAHGRGSSATRSGVPTRFSNVTGSAATSLGLYLAQELYDFRGTASGMKYTSIGLRLKGLATGFNDNARARGVVAHGAPYVTASGAGRSEGCPAVEPDRAEWLLPKLANGGMVFLFAPDQRWMSSDPWLAASNG